MEERWRQWTTSRIPSAPIVQFRIAFATIWLTYDVLDLALGGTRSCIALGAPVQVTATKLATIQLALIVAEIGMLLGKWASPFTLAASVFRGYEAWRLFQLNDFFYFTITALILAQAESDGPLVGTPRPCILAWPRDVLRWQTAWIYFCTGLLKLNPNWLSGEHLFVRLNYLAAARGWPYPRFFLEWAQSIAFDQKLAWFGVSCELALAVLLVLRKPRWLIVALALAVHGFAALFVDVWFFGASMVAQVFFLSMPDGEVESNEVVVPSVAQP